MESGSESYGQMLLGGASTEGIGGGNGQFNQMGNVEAYQEGNTEFEQAGSDEGSKTNLIVNYLPQNLTDDEFREMFEAMGTVKTAKVIRDKATNYSYGFGFVDFSTHEEAQAAIDSLNGLPLQHKTLKVAFAKPPGNSTKNGNLYIQGVPQTMSNEALKDIFSPYGEIISAKVLLNADMTAKGDGFVLFEKQEQAQQAIDDLNGQTLPGGVRPMSVKFAMENKKGQAGAKYPPPPPPGGRGGRGNFGGPMRNRGQQQNRFNPMQQQRGRGAGGGFRGGRGNWRGGANNSNNGFGNDGYGGGFGETQGYGDQAFGDQAFGADYGQGYDESGFGQGYDQSYDQGFDQGYEGGFGGGDEAYYDDGQQGQGSFQSYPENGYQGYYDAIGFQGYQMPGQNKGSFSRGGGRGGGARGGGGRGGGPRGGRGAPRGGGPRGGGRGGGPGPKPSVAPGGGIALYVYNIGPSATDDDVMTIFSHYGSVTKVDVIMDYEKNVTKNYCFVHMATQEEAETAISALNERYCMRPNHPMQVRYHQPKGKGGK